MRTITLQRAYDPPAPSGAYRVLVDRLWPRGIRKDDLELDEWCKDVAPSAELRHEFNHEPERFEAFTADYLDELRATDAPQQLLERAGNRPIVLLYGAKDREHNQAVVLKAYLEELDGA